MVQPINYMAAMPQIDLSRSFANLNQGLADIGKMRQAEAAAEEAKRAQAQYAADLQSTINDGSMQAWATLQGKYPSLAENLGKAAANYEQGYRDKEFSSVLGIQSALENGRVDVARGMIDQKIQALKNSGKNASGYEQVIAELDKGNVKGAMNVANFELMAIDGKRFKDYVDTRGTLSKQPGEVRKVEAEATTAEAVAATEADRRKAEIANVWSQMTERADRLALDQDRLQSEIESRLDERAAKLVELPESSRKIVNDSTGAAVVAEQSTGKLLSLADGLDAESAKGTLGAGWGALGSANEWVRSKLGLQNGLSDLRTEYVRLRNSAALKDLPPGPATDKDVELALKGFPPETSDAKYLASFARGMAKISAREAAYENAKAEWVESVGFMGKPKKDIEVDGVKIAAGTTFPKFAAQYVDRKVKETMGKKTVENRGYMKWATPQAAPATPSGLGSGTYGIGGQ